MDYLTKEVNDINYKIGHFDESIQELKRETQRINNKLDSSRIFERVTELERKICDLCTVYEDVKHLKRYMVIIIILCVLIVNFFSKGALLLTLLEILKHI